MLSDLPSYKLPDFLTHAYYFTIINHYLPEHITDLKFPKLWL
jgi:hypothetical protein